MSAAPATASIAPASLTPTSAALQLVDEAVKKVTTIATLPEVTVQIIKTVEDPTASATQLHRIVANDPALVTRILKVVNSSFYGLPGQIASIERAIVLLGLNAVKNIAVAASLGQMFRGVNLCEGFTAKDLWRHCVSVGVIARELARQMKVQIADEAFLAGMIHDVGILVSLQTNPELLRKVCETARLHAHGPFDFCRIERDVLGMDHQMLGARLAEVWKFPRTCQLVAGHHHQPQSLTEGEHLLVWLVYLADTLCAQAKQGFNLTAVHQTLDTAGLSAIKLDPALIDHTRTNLESLITSASPLL